MSFLTVQGFPPRDADLMRLGLDDASYDLAILADGALVNGLRAAPEYDLDIGYGAYAHPFAAAPAAVAS